MASALPYNLTSSISTPTTTSVSRIAAITQHLKRATLPEPTTKMSAGKATHKIVVCRDLGSDVMPLLKEREEFEVSICATALDPDCY